MATTKRKPKAKPAAKARREHYASDGSYARRLKEREDRDRDEREAEDADPTERKRERYGHAARWWLLEGVDLTNALVGWVERLKARQRRQSLMDTVWEAVYKDAPVGLLADGSPGAAYLRTQQARQNIAMSMVDTVTARIVKRRPMPCISADDAAYSEKRFAKRASRVLRRKMGQSFVDRMCPNVARDGVIRGTGVSKTYRDGGDVCVERVPRRELLVDPQEAQYGTPRVMAQLKRVDRDVLCAMFPERSDDIERATRAPRDEWRSTEDYATDADQVEVMEGWHLPSVPGADDGCHAIVIRGCDPLLAEPWKRPRFPFAFFHWSQPIDGFWGSGLVESIAPIQQEVNGILRDMGEGISLGMQLKIFTPRGSNINKQHLRARNPAVIEHDGAAPQYLAPLPFNPAVLQYLQWRIQQGYELSGISQASAASKNPLGNNASGKALDTMYDLESDRFSHVELQYAMFRVDLGHCILDEARAIAEDDTVEDKAPWITELEWRKVEVDGGVYHLILEPVNFLPESRGGKLATVNEMSKAGLLGADPMQTAALFDEPDIARANRHLIGPYRMLERWCDDLSSEEVPLEDLVPTPLIVSYMPMAVDMVKGELANAIADGASDEEQGRFRWALTMLEAEAGGIGAAPPSVPMPGAMPGAVDPTMAAPPMMPPMPGPLAGDPMGGIAAQAAAGMPVMPPGVS